MKIIEVCFSLCSGGAERFVVDLSNELSKENDVTLLTLKDDTRNTNIRNFYKGDLRESVKYVNLGLADGFHIHSLWKIYRFLKKKSPDIVHLNGENIPFFCILSIILLHKIVFIQTIHNDIACYRNMMYRFLASSSAGRLFNYHFVALSKKNYNDLKDVYPDADSYLVFNGRSPMCRTEMYDDVVNMLHSYDSSALICVHVARFNEAKNQQLLVNSFNRIIKEGINVQLFILGDGFESTEGKNLQSLSCENIHFLGPKKNVADYLNSSDLFCMSSIYEGLPISILEAQLCGIPVVSTPVCGAVDVVEDGKIGVISKDFSEDSYVDALKTAIENLSNLKINAKEWMFHCPYTINNCANEYLKIFRKISHKK